MSENSENFPSQTSSEGDTTTNSSENAGTSSEGQPNMDEYYSLLNMLTSQDRSTVFNDDSIANLQEIARKQQEYHFSMASVMASLKLMEFQDLSDFTVEKAVDYFKLAQERIGHSDEDWKEFLEVMGMMGMQQSKGNEDAFNELLEILHRVSKLFHCHPDLIQGFSAILSPDLKYILYKYSQNFETSSDGKDDPSTGAASSSSSASAAVETPTSDELNVSKELPVEDSENIPTDKSRKKQTSPSSMKSQKKFKPGHLGDPSISHVSKYGTLQDLAFFEKAKKALCYPEVYQNFLRFFHLFNDNVLTKIELVEKVTFFLGNFPDLLREFKVMVRYYDEDVGYLTQRQIRKELEPDLAMDIDYSTGKRHNASYRALPKSFKHPICSGQTALCREVLNDVYVSFPSWSEESPVVTSCKTQYEEMMYRVEDERFELDMAIQSNAHAIKILEDIHKKICKMSDTEKYSFTLDDSLGGNSPVLCFKFIKRIYGDRAEEVMEGLKRNPVVAVPIVLNRLRVREQDWKEIQKKFNAVWKEQINNYYVKSLDHKGANFRQTDGKAMRPKTLISEIETLLQEKRQHIAEGSAMGKTPTRMKFAFTELEIFEDALVLITMVANKQPALSKDDKSELVVLITCFISDFFNVKRKVQTKEKSSDGTENSDSEDKDDASAKEEKKKAHVTRKKMCNKEYKDALRKIPYKPLQNQLRYCLVYVNSQWYLFFRYFQVLCERLASLYKHGLEIDEGMANFGCSSKKDTSMTAYNSILSRIKRLLTGKLDGSSFEEKAREMYGIHAYVSYTIDKIIHNTVKFLNQIHTDDVSSSCIALYANYVQEVKTRNSICPWDTAALEKDYMKKVKQLIGDENCFVVLWDKANKYLMIDLLDSEKDITEEPCIAERWSNYLDDFFCSDPASAPVISPDPAPVALPRNLRNQRKIWKEKVKKKLSAVSVQQKVKNLMECFSVKSQVLLKFDSNMKLITEGEKKTKFTRANVSSVAATNVLLNSSETLHQPLCDVGHVDEVSSLVEANTVYIDSGVSKCLEEEQIEEIIILDGVLCDTDTNEEVSKYINLANDILGCQVPVGEEVVVIVSNESETGLGEVVDFDTDLLTFPIGTQVTVTADGVQASCYEVQSCDGVVDLTPSSEVEIVTTPAVKEEYTDSDSTENQIDSAETEKAIDELNTKETTDYNLETDSVLEGSGQNVITLTDDEFLAIIQGGSLITEESLLKSNIENAVEEAEPEKQLLQPKEGKKAPEDKINSESSSSSSDDESDRPNSSTPKRRLRVEDVHNFKKKRLKIGTKKDASKQDIPPQYECCFCNRSGLECSHGCSKSDKSGPSKDVTHRDCQVHAKTTLLSEEDTQVKFDGISYKLRYVTGSGDYFYRSGTFFRCRRNHRQISLQRSQKFFIWHRMWLDLYVTPNMMKSCNDWILRSDPDKFRVDCITVNDSNKPPYAPFSKYRVRYYKRRYHK